MKVTDIIKKAINTALMQKVQGRLDELNETITRERKLRDNVVEKMVSDNKMREAIRRCMDSALKEHAGGKPYEVTLGDGSTYANLIEVGFDWNDLIKAHEEAARIRQAVKNKEAEIILELELGEAGGTVKRLLEEAVIEW